MSGNIGKSIYKKSFTILKSIMLLFSLVVQAIANSDDLIFACVIGGGELGLDNQCVNWGVDCARVHIEESVISGCYQTGEECLRACFSDCDTDYVVECVKSKTGLDFVTRVRNCTYTVC